MPSAIHHHSQRIGWLRAAVLGANDGILSTAGLVIGVASAEASAGNVLLAGVAGLVAGAMSMAAGEYVSVSSQADTERADLELERRALATNAQGEREELADIYVSRGLDRALALQVADQLSAHDALAAHARDELGLSGTLKARPVQAAVTSALTFSVGAAMPIAAAVLAPADWIAPVVAGASLVSLAGLGAIAARAGGASALTGALRVLGWGALAMIATAAIGRLVGTTV
ncbi:VIT1/CCC1 transporter family protein [Dokdonella koreensis]|uniref:Membrane protein n=1 Tax=Dokdonella koreensis DS-123 TaxID=1300342 RepID=A0A167G400_9GAMM|nr:VIT family protein [Dokdonella koreensis]ANB16134.1 Putative membrane protein [Dokdonella koreensis DS-123]